MFSATAHFLYNTYYKFIKYINIPETTIIIAKSIIANIFSFFTIDIIIVIIPNIILIIAINVLVNSPLKNKDSIKYNPVTINNIMCIIFINKLLS